LSDPIQVAITVIVAHALAVASPGPDFAIVLRQAMTQGRGPALWTSLGIGLGIAIHVSYALFGIALVISQTPWLMRGIQLAGAAYLLWIAWHAIRAQPQTGDALGSGEQAHSAWRSLRIGFITNVLNPKATLFFLSLFTVIVGPGQPLWLQLGLGAWLCVMTAAWFAFVSCLFTAREPREWFLRRAHLIDRGMGVLLAVLAARLIWTALAG